jgi:hypothetical protein
VSFDACRAKFDRVFARTPKAAASAPHVGAMLGLVIQKLAAVVLSAGLLTCRSRVQREGEVIHRIKEHPICLSVLRCSESVKPD